MNRGFIIFLTVIITLLCLYYLSFTLVSRNVQQDATEYATNDEGVVAQAKKRAYLDSIRNEPIYNFLGIDYTLEDVNDNKLNLGLDLQGGMHVVLEVSPSEIIQGISGGSEDPDFLQALEIAREQLRTSEGQFVDFFYDAWQDVAPDKKLSTIFANASNRGRIDFSSSDQQVIDLLQSEVEDAIERSFIILRTRIDQFGTTQPNIQRLQGSGRIQVELPGADDPERVRRLLQSVAKLEFWEVYEIDNIYPSLMAINEKLVQEQQLAQNNSIPASDLSDRQDAVGDLGRQEEPELAQALSEDRDSTDLGDLLAADEDQQILDNQESDSVDTIDTDLATQLAQVGDSTGLDSLSAQVSPLFGLLRSQYGLIYSVADTNKINRILNRPDIQSMLPRDVKFLWDAAPKEFETEEELVELYPIKTRRGEAPLTGEVITDARQTIDETASPAVSMNMNTQGGREWSKLTGENIGSRIAIVLDDLVRSAPRVQNQITGGQSQITGNFTLDEAKDLANILKAGTLPARTRIVEEAIVGPTLGREARAQGITSIVTGLLLVVVFMVLYYARGGLVANVALVFNIFFILGVLAQFKAALTLPGIAGIVLTIGMSIDANVLIFERIREELRNGAGVLKAISNGYDKAFSSIIDANVTTFLTGVILYVLGQGPVKGFAVTLMIGIASSFFSAVFITRVIVYWMSKKGDESKLSFSSNFTKNFLSNLNIQFLNKRRIAYMFSGTTIVIGIVLIILQGGLNLGVDFTGGRSFVVEFNKPMVTSEIEVALQDDFQGSGTEVKTFGANNVLKITTSYLVQDESDDADDEVKSALIAGIGEATGMEYSDSAEDLSDQEFSIVSSSKVGATIADDIKRASTEAVVFSLIVIFLYILIRFRKWQFGLGAVVALFHDVLVTLAAFAIARLFGKAFEVDQVFIAAMLTIIGYSINDTVVVFDRIRENLAIKPSSDIEKTFNLSLNDTISRTLITSGTTLLVVLVLLIFGGEVLRGFSFALLIGILVGTYSSIFVATPVVIDLYKKKIVKESEQAPAKKVKQKA